MLSRLREPGGGMSFLAAGLACLALGGFILFVPLPGIAQLGIGAVAMVAAGVCFWRAWQASRRDPYDLKGLWDREDPPEEPEWDTLDSQDIPAPYCGYCDEVYEPGTHRCRQCGRSLT
jgi:hypothetical protein